MTGVRGDSYVEKGLDFSVQGMYANFRGVWGHASLGNF